MVKKKSPENSLPTLSKACTGIRGLDEITVGGLPRGRPTLICGSAGCGKTLMAMEFLVRGATDYDEPGVFVSFEENSQELTENVRSLGFDLEDLARRKKVFLDYVRVERSEIEETGSYNLDGLFVRLAYAIDAVRAKRIVLDTIEALFAGLSNHAILRAELRRLFRWLKDRGLTAIITGERGENTLTRYGLEEYVADCVILLDHRVTDQVSTRRLRIVKYRGSTHGTNEYPFLIDETGITVMPVTSLRLDQAASSDRVSSGIAGLDAMLGGEGFYRGTSILVSGTAGTGKSSLSAHFANAVCSRGESCLYFAFEESPAQIIRNMSSIGLDLQRWVDKGLLRFEAARPSLYGLETHLAGMHKRIEELNPSGIVVDPVTSFTSIGSLIETQSMLARLVDYCKSNQITSIYTALTTKGGDLESSAVGISSIMDTWLLLRDFESNGERNRGLYILKSRGMAHSNQVREFQITSQGINLLSPYLGEAGVLMGTARASQEAKERAGETTRREEMDRMQRELKRKRRLLESEIARLQYEYQQEEDEAHKRLAEAREAETDIQKRRAEMAEMRRADTPTRENGKGTKSRRTAK